MSDKLVQSVKMSNKEMMKMKKQIEVNKVTSEKMIKEDEWDERMQVEHTKFGIIFFK